MILRLLLELHALTQVARSYALLPIFHVASTVSRYLASFPDLPTVQFSIHVAYNSICIL